MLPNWSLTEISRFSRPPLRTKNVGIRAGPVKKRTTKTGETYFEYEVLTVEGKVEYPGFFE